MWLRCSRKLVALCRTISISVLGGKLSSSCAFSVAFNSSSRVMESSRCWRSCSRARSINRRRLRKTYALFPWSLYGILCDGLLTIGIQLLGLELVKIILFTIPYVMASPATGFEGHANALLEKTDIIASTPHALVDLVKPFAKEDEEPVATPSVISLLQTQLQAESSRNWELVCLPRPWNIPPEGEEEQKPLEPGTRHAFPQITVPNPVPNGARAIFPEVYLSVYANQEVETVPPLSDITSSLLRDSLVDTINLLDFNRIATAKFLIDVDCYFTPHTFVKRATPFDRLRELPQDRPTWKPEDVVVDAVFSQLYQLPTPEHKLVYYHSVLTECCKIAPAAIAPSLGRAIRFLYRGLEVMDLDLSHRFLDWFSHHLSNFGFTWKWSEW